jgi:hypothetical protein
MSTRNELETDSSRDDRFEIIKLEERIAPFISNNHNETLASSDRFEIIKLEERIAPFLNKNHNETLVCG